MLLPIFDTVFYPQYFSARNHCYLTVLNFPPIQLFEACECGRTSNSRCLLWSGAAPLHKACLSTLRTHRRAAPKGKRWLLSGDWSNFVFARSPFIWLYNRPANSHEAAQRTGRQEKSQALCRGLFVLVQQLAVSTCAMKSVL